MASLDALSGVPCHAPTFDGSTKVVYTGSGSALTYFVSLQCVDDSKVTLTLFISSYPKPIPYDCGGGNTCYAASTVHGSVTGDSGGVSCIVDGGLVSVNSTGGLPIVIGSQHACDFRLPRGSTVVLTAEGTPTFRGWGDGCAAEGTNSTCTLTLDGDKQVTADWVDNS